MDNLQETSKQLEIYLTKYNLWRRGDENIEMPEPKELGLKIEAACNLIRDMQARINELETENINWKAKYTDLDNDYSGSHHSNILEKSELRNENIKLLKALKFYENGFEPYMKNGVLLYRATEKLKDDCGNIARTTIGTIKGAK